jgi:hypothetical protein
MARSKPPTKSPSFHLDSFSKPQDVPGHWDLSEITSREGSPLKTEPEPTNGRAPGPDEITPSAQGKADPGARLHCDPFPTPATFPSAWDLSELTSR